MHRHLPLGNLSAALRRDRRSSITWLGCRERRAWRAKAAPDCSQANLTGNSSCQCWEQDFPLFHKRLGRLFPISRRSQQWNGNPTTRSAIRTAGNTWSGRPSPFQVAGAPHPWACNAMKWQGFLRRQFRDDRTCPLPVTCDGEAAMPRAAGKSRQGAGDLSRRVWGPLL